MRALRRSQKFGEFGMIFNHTGVVLSQLQVIA